MVLASLMLSACSGGGGTTANKATPAAPAKTPVPVLANVPAGCPSKTTLTVKTTTLAAAPFDAVSGLLVTRKANPDTAELVFGDFTIASDNMYSGLEGGGSYKVSFDLSTKNKKPVVVGKYSQKPEDSGKVSRLGLATKDSLVGFIGSNSSVDLKYLDATYGCGTINIDDGYASVKGDFIAQVYAK